METGVMFLDCPAYTDRHGAARCGLPAEVEYRYTVESTDGLLESAKIRCPRGHWFSGPMESLTWDKHAGATVPLAEGAHSRDTAARALISLGRIGYGPAAHSSVAARKRSGR